ncbi:MAG: DUF1501 domain-containing protein [Planctomycetota bacterium]
MPPSNARRHFLRNCGIGLGNMALATMGARTSAAADPTEMNAVPHFPATAKRVIYLFMAGAPSQLELFDHKPKLRQLEGSPIPPEVIKGQRYAFIQPDAAVLGPQFRFARHGQSGAELSEVLPHLSTVVDEIAIAKSVYTDQFNHAPAQLLMNTGNGVPGRPSMGSWFSYGLGSEADDLPSFVVLKSGGSLSGGSAMWSNGFLPGTHHGVPFRDSGDPILHVSNPKGIDSQAQRDSIDLIQNMNRRRFDVVGDPDISTRIDAYEMAFRMQARAPELMDFASENAATLQSYGIVDGQPSSSFGRNCLLARRLAERGVRFIQVYHAGWDHHSNVAGGIRGQTRQTDQGCAALIKDLKQRGMLDDTLVVWGGEFGRTPMVESSAALGRSKGRDHHPQAFTMWFAGGGIRPGITIGKTDELGFNIVEKPIHIADVQATIMHCMGIDHERLSVNVNGLEIRLTGVEPHAAVSDLLRRAPG